MTLPFLQLMVGLGIGILGFFILRPRAISHENNPGGCYAPSPPARGNTRRRKSKEEDQFISKPGDLCMICLYPMDNVNMSYIKCGHALHENCVRELKNQKINECPACRHKI